MLMWMHIGIIHSPRICHDEDNALLTGDRHMWTCFAACPAGCSFCTYDGTTSQTKCILGQCDVRFVMKYDGTCLGKKPLGLRETIIINNIYEYRHIYTFKQSCHDTFLYKAECRQIFLIYSYPLAKMPT